jgi:hypothetical protein
MRTGSPQRFLWRLITLASLLLPTLTAHAQQPAAPPAPGEEDDLPVIRDTWSGYIDTALPLDMVRLRFDSAFDNRQPSRGEFFYAQPKPLGPGLPLRESNVDYQDLSLYIERKFGQRLSAFVEMPYRFANFEVNVDHSGLSDINAGFKFALVENDCNVGTFQFRVFTPTGAESRGLGTGHYSLEPAFLLYHRFSDRLTSESEARVWVPIDGTDDIPSTVLRYGTGVSYTVWSRGEIKLAPVAEFVGWTFLDGKKAAPFGSGLPPVSASGDTIVNAKLGARLKFGDRFDIYGGYGRALTGDPLYKDIYRIEARLFYGPSSRGCNCCSATP